MGQAHGKVADYEALTADPDLATEVDRIVPEVNDKRSRVESVRRYPILPQQLTIAAGGMTPTLKVERRGGLQRPPGARRRDLPSTD